MIPTSKYMIFWTLFASFFNLMSIYLVTFNASFHLMTVTEPTAFIWVIEAVLLFDMIFLFFKAFRVTESDDGFFTSSFKLVSARCLNKKKMIKVKKKKKRDKKRESEWKTKFKKISGKYLGGSFIFDFLS